MIQILNDSQDADSKEDEKLRKRVLEGDSRAFAALARKYRPRILSLGMGFFKDSDDAEDFLQEVLVKIYLSLRQFQAKSRFSTWVTKIAYNTAVNSIKRRKTYVSLAEDFENGARAGGRGFRAVGGAEDVAETPEDAAVKKATIAAIREAVSSLPDPYRVCIDFFFFYDMSYSEIAEAAGIPINTVRSHIFRAKKILRRYLDEIA